MSHRSGGNVNVANRCGGPDAPPSLTMRAFHRASIGPQNSQNDARHRPDTRSPVTTFTQSQKTRSHHL